MVTIPDRFLRLLLSNSHLSSFKLSTLFYPAGRSVDKMATPISRVGPMPLSSTELEDKIAAFDAVPLFMKSLPNEDTNDGVIAALQSLAHEGTPDGT